MNSKKSLNLLETMICDLIHHHRGCSFEDLQQQLANRCDQWSSILQPLSFSGLHRKLNSLVDQGLLEFSTHRKSTSSAHYRKYYLTESGKVQSQLVKQMIGGEKTLTLDFGHQKSKKSSPMERFEISQDEIGVLEEEGGVLIQDFAFPDSRQISEKDQQALRKVTSEFVSYILTELDIKVQIPQEFQPRNVLNHSPLNPAEVEGDYV
ncbi:hypothetical protein [Candidatus Lokiarchaeum ossiferum]|uniref:hypothetical protein n=1 Tax=Candidatus Lokiarchaeum ossiferum TaxID=2951803 RepID=UPI00352CBF02